MINNDYKTIRKAIERLNYLRREIARFGGTEAICGLLARVSYRLEEILAGADHNTRYTYKSDIKEEFDYVCAWYDYLVKASLPEAEYLEQARIELRNALNELNYDSKSNK